MYTRVCPTHVPDAEEVVGVDGFDVCSHFVNPSSDGGPRWHALGGVKAWLRGGLVDEVE